MRSRGMGAKQPLGLQVLSLLVLYSAVTSATCPHFGAWLKPVGNVFNNLEGFVTLQVAPDAKSVVVSMQVWFRVFPFIAAPIPVTALRCVADKQVLPLTDHSPSVLFCNPAVSECGD